MARQTAILDSLSHGSRVAIVRLRSLGDCVLTTPALQLLRHARPDLHIRVVVEDRFAPIFGECALSPSALMLRSFHPDLCLNLHGGTRSARLTLLAGARFRAGFDIFRPAWIYNRRIPTAQETMRISRRVHTAEHLASAMFYLGVPLSDVPRAAIPVPAGRSPYAPERRYAVIHPFAATPAKTWPSDNFLALARHIEKVLHLEPLFVGGPDEDLSGFAPWRAVAGAPLTELAKLMRDAALFCGNDSGPAHIAAAFGVPELVFFGPSDSEVWAPWRTPSQILRSEGSLASIPVQQAIDALEKLRLPSQVGV